MNSQNDDQLAKKTREAFRALPAKQRCNIFKRAAPDSTPLLSLLQAAHIPPSLQPARIAHWLTPEQQGKLEVLLLSPDHEPWLKSLLCYFFMNVHPTMNHRFLSLVDPDAPAPTTFEAAYGAIEKEFAQDPYLYLYLAAGRWVSHNEMIAQNKLIADGAAAPQKAPAASPDKRELPPPVSTTFSELDKQLQVVSAAVAKLQGVQPVEIATAVTSLQRAHALTTSLMEELKSSAKQADEPEPIWSSREGFVAHRDRIAELLSGRNKMLQRATNLAATLTTLLAGVVVKHRFPNRSVTLTGIAHRAANELREHTSDFTALVLNHSGEAMDWLEWLWKQEGAEAENLQQKLQPVSPALADLLADASWPDLQWPEPAPASAPVPRPLQLAAPQGTPTPSLQPVATPRQDKAPVAPPPPEQRPSSTPPQEAAPVPAVPQQQPAVTHPDSPKPVTIETPSAPQPKTLSSFEAPIAKPAPASASAEDRSPISSDVWRLASAKRWGLASHVATLSSPNELPPPWLFEAAAIAPRINYEVSPLSERLTKLFAHSADFRIDSLRQDVRPVARLLLAAVALRPALLAPKTGAASLLKLSELVTVPKLLAVGQFVEAVAEFGLHRQALSPEMLRAPHNVADWERQLARVRVEIHQWLEQAPLRGFNYAIAARIWRKWTTHNGPIQHLLQETMGANLRQLDALRKQWEPWATRAAEFVQSGIQEFNHRKTMDGTARDKLIERIGEAVRLAERVFVLLSQTPEPVGTFRDEQVHLLLAACHRHLAPAHRELNTIIASSRDDAIAATARLCDESLEQINDLLQGHLPLPGGDEPKPRWILDAELLRDPMLHLPTDGDVMTLGASQRDALLALARTPPDWKAAWARQIEAENHVGTAALLEFFRWQPPSGLDIAELERQHDHELQASRQRLQAKADDTRRCLEEFVSLGLCREQDYTNWTAEVQAVENSIPSSASLSQLRNRLEKVSKSVADQRATEANRVRQQLDNLQDVPPQDRLRVAALLDSEDIHTATDYLDRLTRRLPLPQPGSFPSIFRAFFDNGGWLKKFEGAFRDAPLADCWNAAGEGKPWNGLDFQLLNPQQREVSISQLQLWDNLERLRRPDNADVGKLVSALGLQPAKITPQPLRSGAHIVQPFLIQAQPLDERSSAVVPAFGSDASGRYTLQLVWGEPGPEELLYLCRREVGDTSAHIIVTFRFLTSKDRHQLAHEARKPDRAFKGIVIDRGLYAFTCAQPAARFPTLLRCALPFSCVEPYTITAGDVPPEMFYGRGRELQSLAALRGSCFVYGGRQLGKTALLRALERRFRNPQRGCAVIFVDLKRELFSRGRGVDGLWSVLVNRLQEANVLDSKVGASAGQEALFRHVKEWLAASPDRRLLLLLDEADTFLEEDGKETDQHEPFPRCQRLKGLMEDTERRFKVIFAGLHNVQRTTRTANHPLAHFGEAVCIGPMLEEAESREARALVEEPLAAAGYFFQSHEVVSRILALTNYYPSLIQIFCHHLLVDLRANHVTRFQHASPTPPCIITSQHVQTAYGSSVRKQIDIKVGLTLDLDKRYKLIALLLAFYSANQPVDNGVPLRDIRADATELWPAGFNEMRTDDEFRSLLEEMVGLGILRQIPDSGKFALRNHNVTTLLGNPEEITRQLDEAKQWEPTLKYEADKFRRLLTDPPKLTFSPLTTQQESELKASENRVAILYGVPAAGLPSVPDAMRSDNLFGRSRTHIPRECRDANALFDFIARSDRKPQSNSIILVPADLPWDETWVAGAYSKLQTFTSKDAFLTVLFIADAHRTAATLQGLEGAAEGGIRQLTLHPWRDAAVRHWLEELGIIGDQASEAARKAIKTVTGNWPELLMRLNTSHPEGLRAACEDINSLFSDLTQLPQLRTAFGFTDQSAEKPLRIAAQLEEFTIEEICDYAEAPDEDARQRIAQQIAWADRLSLVTLSGAKLRIDPIAAKILLQSAEME